jgi:hypothetical protein
MSDLETVLRAAKMHQVAIRLVAALEEYGAHTPECRGPGCSCGYLEVRALVKQAKQTALPEA